MDFVVWFIGLAIAGGLFAIARSLDEIAKAVRETKREEAKR